MILIAVLLLVLSPWIGAQISFNTEVETTDCCAGKCGITDQVLKFPATGHPGFTFSITGNLPKKSEAWHLQINGTVEGVPIINASVAGCGTVTAPIAGKLIGSITINFPACPIAAGPITLVGSVKLHIPIPWGFSAVVHVRITDGTTGQGQLLNCEQVIVAGSFPTPPPTEGAQVIVAGDSWGAFGAKPFVDMFRKHKSNASVYNMAAGGTTSEDWSEGPVLDDLVYATSLPRTQRIWMSFGGNDAIEKLPLCALEIDPVTGEGKTIDQCTDELMDKVLVGLDRTLARIKKANPNVRIVGFGYDIMGLGKLPVCPLVAPEIMPQCWNKTVHPEGHIHCFNQQFLKIQGVWDMLSTTARGLGIVDTVTLLGTLQAYGNDTHASVGHPDLDKWGINKLWQLNCIHPTEDVGFPVIFDEFWDLYWSKQNFTIQ